MAERVTLASLQEELAAVTKERDEKRVRVTELEADLSAEQSRHEGAKAQVRELTARNEAQAGEIHTLGGQLRAYKGSATKARNEATMLKAALSPESRKLGKLPPPADDAARADLRLAIDAAIAAGPVSLVFSDGRKEIRELAPLIVSGDAWRHTPRGQILQLTPLLEPGDMTPPKVSIAGVALLDEAGEQVGWRQFPDVVDVPRNGRVQLPIGAIIF